MFQALESHTALSKFDSQSGCSNGFFFETGTESSSCRRHLPSGLTQALVCAAPTTSNSVFCFDFSLYG